MLGAMSVHGSTTNPSVKWTWPAHLITTQVQMHLISHHQIAVSSEASKIVGGVSRITF
jgi:hypothetical protein